MKLTLDGKGYEEKAEFADWENFIKVICQKLLKQDLGVLKLTIDGEALPLFTLDELSKFNISEVKHIDIKSQNIYETIKTILEEIGSILPETEYFHSQVASLIQEGKEGEALKVLELVLKYWQNLVQVVKTIGEISSVKKITLPNFDDISREFTQLNEISQQIKDSIRVGDFINVADTVEQSLKSKVWVWKKIIDDLYDFILRDYCKSS